MATPWSNLDRKIIMVTGASSGLGLEFCLNLAKARCRIVAAARRIEKLNFLCDQINRVHVPSSGTNGGSSRAIAVELDVTADGPIIEMSVKKAWNSFGHIEALVNNADVRGKFSSLHIEMELRSSQLIVSIVYVAQEN